jgi:dTDP-4-dehydrorhamnose reductase
VPRHFVIEPAVYGVQGSGGRAATSSTMLRALLGETLRRRERPNLPPSYTVDVAAATAALLETRFGLYHVTNSGSCSLVISPRRSSS